MKLCYNKHMLLDKKCELTFITNCLININKNARRENISFWLGRGPSFKKRQTHAHTLSISKTSKLSIKFPFPTVFPLIYKERKGNFPEEFNSSRKTSIQSQCDCIHSASNVQNQLHRNCNEDICFWLRSKEFQNRKMR